MELETQAFSTPSSPRFYVTAPASPNAYGRSNSLEYYYSAPTSPQKKTSDFAKNNTGAESNKIIIDPISEFDDFEFETSMKFTGQMNVEMEKRFDTSSGMLFADELFLDGLLMPLKLPPRLQYDSECTSFRRTSPLLSPKSPRTVCTIPFARWNVWSKDFDPFTVALQKVRQEKRGTDGSRRRSRSYSPFRNMSKSPSYKGNSRVQPVQEQVPAMSFSGPLDFKGSSYARWVRDQRREEGVHSKPARSPRAFLFGQRVRPLKTEKDGADKQTYAKGKYAKEKCGNGDELSKVKKLKGIIMRYASFGKEKSKVTSEVRKTSYLSRLGLKFKGNVTQKKNRYADTKLAIVEYKPSTPMRLGYGVGSPRKMNTRKNNNM